MNTIILYSNVSTRNILLASLFFLAIILCMVVFIVGYLIRSNRKTSQRHKLKQFYSEIISSICICESEEELSDYIFEVKGELKRIWNQDKQAISVFTREMQKVQENLSGQAIQNIIWVYENLDMVSNTLKQLKSSHWHNRVAAIQQLAAFNQVKHIKNIYKETNNSNQYIRDAAQIAIVQLLGFNGLRFLRYISQPVSQWQQIQVLNQLDGKNIKPDKLIGWMQSENSTVVEFILRLIEKFRLYDCHDHVYFLKDHISKSVRLQVLQVIKELPDEDTPLFLENWFSHGDIEEKKIILDIISRTGAKEQIPFLLNLLYDKNDLIRYKALCCIKSIQPAYVEKVYDQIQHDSSFDHIMSVVKKQNAT